MIQRRVKRIAARLEVPAERAVATAAWVTDPIDEAVGSFNEELCWGFAAAFDWIEARLIRLGKAARTRRRRAF